MTRLGSVSAMILMLAAACSGGDSEDSESAGGACYDDIEIHDTTAGATNDLMQMWGAPCASDGDCEALLGAGAICDAMAVVYELPGGYCTKPCDLPDTSTTVVLDHPMCDPGGGIACVGAKGNYSRCAVPCTDDRQCTRDGYTCRQMPTISIAGDPEFCLMPDCCEDSCAKG